MHLFKNLMTKLFKPKHHDEPWLEYYSREERSIKFTTKSIYNYMVDEVGDDKDYIALNYFENRISYNEFFDNIDICARALRSYGIKEKDIVTICLPNMPEALYVFYACNKINLTAKCTNANIRFDFTQFLRKSKFILILFTHIQTKLRNKTPMP